MSHAARRRTGRIGHVIGIFIFGLAKATVSTTARAQYVNMTGQVSPELVETKTTSQLIFNAYGGPITVTSAGLSGPSAAFYSMVKNTCTNGVVLTVTATCEIDVLFAPQQFGPLTEDIVMGSSAGPQSFDISSYGTVQNFLVSPTAIDFGFQPIGTTSATRTVTIKNPNPIAVFVATDLNYPSGDFQFAAGGGCPDTIPANSSCSYQIQWTPRVAGADVGYWEVPVGLLTYGGDDFYEEGVEFTGQGVQDGATSVSLTTANNTAGIGIDGQKVSNGGLDGAGNVYSSDFFASGVTWAGQSFQIQTASPNAIRDSTLTLPAGQYYSVTLLGTGVNGNQLNQAFTITYSDGTTGVVHQNLSDWKTPQHYVGESIAVTTPYRLTVDGATHTGPYYLYAYALPIDHTKTAVSVSLPPTRNVAVLALNAGVAGVPVTADLTGLFNVTAVGMDGEAVASTGIDKHDTAISQYQLGDSAPLNELLIAIPTPNVANAVANVTVPLPSGQYSTLHLDGMAVNGNKPLQTLTVNYSDGTSTAITQSFSDWHTSQKYSRESIAVAMTYKLDPDGSVHKGVYNLYQYDIPIDATKLVSSVVLPTSSDIVILSVALKP